MRSIKILALVLGLTFQICAQVDTDSNSYDKSLVVGEDLTYVVKYAFLRLGEVRIRVVEKLNIRNTPVYKTMAYIDSYPDLPFVSLHQVYESYIDASFFPHRFFALIFNDDTTVVNYAFFDSTRIEIEKGRYNSNKLWLDSTAIVDKRMQDGLSILFFARLHSGKNKQLEIPCFVNEKEELTKINFYDESEAVTIDSIDYEIDCTRIEGETDFVSVYGLTGYFEGWFSNDDFSVPIIAKMQVLIGNITLELIDWNEMIWNPPLYKN